MKNRMYVRYYRKDGRYLDHSRVAALKGVEPMPGSQIAPFHVKWTVTDVKWPEKDSCVEVYVDYDGAWMSQS